MTEYQLLDLARRARDVRRRRLAVIALVLWAVLMASCGPDTAILEAAL